MHLHNVRTNTTADLCDVHYDTSNFQPSSNTSAVLEDGHFENPLPRVHLGISNVCNFLISEQKHKVWVLIFLIRP